MDAVLRYCDQPFAAQLEPLRADRCERLDERRLRRRGPPRRGGVADAAGRRPRGHARTGDRRASSPPARAPRAARPAPLLALPTHAGGWIAPARARRARAGRGRAADEVELAQALLRLAPEGRDRGARRGRGPARPARRDRCAARSAGADGARTTAGAAGSPRARCARAAARRRSTVDASTTIELQRVARRPRPLARPARRVPRDRDRRRRLARSLRHRAARLAAATRPRRARACSGTLALRASDRAHPQFAAAGACLLELLLRASASRSPRSALRLAAAGAVLVRRARSPARRRPADRRDRGRPRRRAGLARLREDLPRVLKPNRLGAAPDDDRRAPARCSARSCATCSTPPSAAWPRSSRAPTARCSSPSTLARRRAQACTTRARSCRRSRARAKRRRRRGRCSSAKARSRRAKSTLALEAGCGARSGGRAHERRVAQPRRCEIDPETVAALLLDRRPSWIGAFATWFLRAETYQSTWPHIRPDPCRAGGAAPGRPLSSAACSPRRAARTSARERCSPATRSSWTATCGSCWLQRR